MKIDALIKLMPHLEPFLKKKGREKARVQSKKTIGKVGAEKKLEQDKDTRKSVNAAWFIDKNITEEMLDKKLREIIGSRGRKGTNVKETIRALEVLAKASRLHGPKKEIPVLMYLIASLFDFHKSIDEYMELSDWRTGYRYMNRILNILDQNPNIVLNVMDGEDATDAMKNLTIDSVVENITTSTDKSQISIKIVGSLETFLSRLEEEYIKSLQQISPHTQVCQLYYFFIYPLSNDVSA